MIKFIVGWADVFGSLSGDDPKIKDPIERYLLTNFAYTTDLGPTQTASIIRSEYC